MPNSIDSGNENGKPTTEFLLENSSRDEIMTASDSKSIYDGPLDPNSNYTGFVEVIGTYPHNLFQYRFMF